MMTAIEQANLLAGHAVAHAEAFLDQRHTARQLAAHADKLQLELMTFFDPSISMALDAVRMLQLAMDRASRPSDATRSLYWRAVLRGLVALVRNESCLLAERMASE